MTTSTAPEPYRTLADFRYALRRFIAFSEGVARAAGLTPRQHQALLALKGSDAEMGVGELAERLVIQHNSAVGLVDRMEAAGLVRRRASDQDRRRVRLTLTARAEAVLAELTSAHLEELHRLAPAMRAILDTVQRPEPGVAPRPRSR